MAHYFLIKRIYLIQRWFGDLERATRDATSDFEATRDKTSDYGDYVDEDITANLNGVDLSLGQERGLESAFFLF